MLYPGRWNEDVKFKGCAEISRKSEKISEYGSAAGWYLVLPQFWLTEFLYLTNENSFSLKGKSVVPDILFGNSFCC